MKVLALSPILYSKPHALNPKPYLKALGIHARSHEPRDMKRLIDSDESGEISIDEFVAGPIFQVQTPPAYRV